MNKRIQFILLLVVFILPTFAIQAQKKQGRSEPREINVPEGLTYEVLQYRHGEHMRAGQMAISYKDDGLKNKPVVVFIHGGGWANGDKDSATGSVFNVAKKGFVGITISYRLLSEGSFINCIEDVKEAIRFFKSKQDDLPIDVNRIGVWGYSAGAHLALMIALSPEDTFHSNTFIKFNSKIKSVMAVSAPTDFVSFQKERGSMRMLSESQNKNIEFLMGVSPLTFINKNQIPVFMLHGTADPLVKPYHYLNFKKKCKEKGLENFKLFEIENGGHMFYWKRKEEVVPIFQEFLNSI